MCASTRYSRKSKRKMSQTATPREKGSGRKEDPGPGAMQRGKKAIIFLKDEGVGPRRELPLEQPLGGEWV